MADTHNSKIHIKPVLKNRSNSNEPVVKNLEKVSGGNEKSIKSRATVTHLNKSDKLEHDNDDEKPLKTHKKRHSMRKDSLPSNINNYKHLIDTLLLTGKDIEWVLQLRGHKKFRIEDNSGKPKDGGGAGSGGGDEEQKETRGAAKRDVGPPSFFQKDYDHYFETKEELNKKAKYHLYNHTGNSNNFEHLMSKRVGGQSNPTLLNYETNLRIFPPNCTLKGPSKEWSPPPNMQKSVSQIPKFLPPLMKMSEKNLAKIDEFVSRPLVPEYTDVNIHYLLKYYIKIKGCKLRPKTIQSTKQKVFKIKNRNTRLNR